MKFRTTYLLLVSLLFVVACSQKNIETTIETFDGEYYSLQHPSDWTVTENGKELFLTNEPSAESLYDIDKKFDGVTMNIAFAVMEDGKQAYEQPSISALEQMVLELELEEGYLPTNKVERVYLAELEGVRYKKVQDFGLYEPDWDGIDLQLEISVIPDPVNDEMVFIYVVDSGKEEGEVNGSDEIDPILESLVLK